MSDPKARLLLQHTGLSDLVANCLFTERRATVGDAMPGHQTASAAVGSADRRGWWADPTFGSRLWETQAGKITPEILERQRMYAAEALKRLQSAGIIGEVGTAADYLTDAGGRNIGTRLTVTISAPGADVQTLYFDDLWGAI